MRRVVIGPLPGGVRLQPRRARLHDQRARRRLTGKGLDGCRFPPPTPAAAYPRRRLPMIRTLRRRRPALSAAAPASRRCPRAIPRRSRCRSSTRSPRRATSPYPGTITLDVDATDTERGIFRVKRDDPGRRRRADGAALSRSGCPATTRRAARSRSSPGWSSRANGKRAAVDARSGRRLRLPHRRAGGREGARRRVPVPVRDQGRPGPDRR